MRRSDIVAGIVLTLFGLISLFAIIPAQIGSDAGTAGVAPDVFPLTLMSLFTGVAALLAVSRLARGYKADDELPPPTVHNFAFIIAASVVLLGSFLAITYLGFIVGGALKVAVAMLAMDGKRHLVRLVAVSIIAPLVVFAVFRYVFIVLLP